MKREARALSVSIARIELSLVTTGTNKTSICLSRDANEDRRNRVEQTVTRNGGN